MSMHISGLWTSSSSWDKYCSITTVSNYSKEFQGNCPSLQGMKNVPIISWFQQAGAIWWLAGDGVQRMVMGGKRQQETQMIDQVKGVVITVLHLPAISCMLLFIFDSVKKIYIYKIKPATISFSCNLLSKAHYTAAPHKIVWDSHAARMQQFV